MAVLAALQKKDATNSNAHRPPGGPRPATEGVDASTVFIAACPPPRPPSRIRARRWSSFSLPPTDPAQLVTLVEVHGRYTSGIRDVHAPGGRPQWISGTDGHIDR